VLALAAFLAVRIHVLELQHDTKTSTELLRL
jgi:hypothetical protein